MIKVTKEDLISVSRVLGLLDACKENKVFKEETIKPHIEYLESLQLEMKRNLNHEYYANKLGEEIRYEVDEANKEDAYIAAVFPQYQTFPLLRFHFDDHYLGFEDVKELIKSLQQWLTDFESEEEKAKARWSLNK